MKEYRIGKNDAGQRLDRWLGKTLPLLPPALGQKYIRLKRVKRNGKGARRDAHLEEGDLVQLYINDEFFQTPTAENAFLSIHQPKLTILYEDEHILLLDKRPGLVVHPDETERVNTLITQVQAHLYQKGEWSPYRENSFAPALCNRIDRNTGGIVIAAKTALGLRVMNQKIRDREIEKDYLCVVQGEMKPPAGTLRGYILRDEAKKQVSVHKTPQPGGKTAITEYRTLAVKDGLSLVQCRLHTGRTHQIRAQFAQAGHPLLGDGKYGSGREGKAFGRSGQALYAYRLGFHFTTDAQALNPLNGKSWRVAEVSFVRELFPEMEKRMFGPDAAGRES